MQIMQSCQELAQGSRTCLDVTRVDQGFTESCLVPIVLVMADLTYAYTHVQMRNSCQHPGMFLMRLNSKLS